MSSRRIDNIETLLEQLGFLQITNKILDKTTEQLNKTMSVVLVPVTMATNRQTIIPKSMISDPE